MSDDDTLLFQDAFEQGADFLNRHKLRERFNELVEENAKLRVEGKALLRVCKDTRQMIKYNCDLPFTVYELEKAIAAAVMIGGSKCQS